MEEVWKDIEGYEGWYQVSNYGRVKSLKRRHRSCQKDIDILEQEKILKLAYCGKQGKYLSARLYSNKDKKTFQVHRLVANAFIKNPFGLKQVDHMNRNTKDNRAENLRWVSQSENQYNSTRNHLIEYKGEIKPLGKWAEEYGLRHGLLSSRLRYGWSIERALETPLDIKRSMAKKKER